MLHNCTALAYSVREATREAEWAREALEKIKAMFVQHSYECIKCVRIFLLCFSNASRCGESERWFFFRCCSKVQSRYSCATEKMNAFSRFLVSYSSRLLHIFPTIILKCTVAYLAYQTRCCTTNFLRRFSTTSMIIVAFNPIFIQTKPTTTTTRRCRGAETVHVYQNVKTNLTDENRYRCCACTLWCMNVRERKCRPRDIYVWFFFVNQFHFGWQAVHFYPNEWNEMHKHNTPIANKCCLIFTSANHFQLIKFKIVTLIHLQIIEELPAWRSFPFFWNACLPCVPAFATFSVNYIAFLR